MSAEAANGDVMQVTFTAYIRPEPQGSTRAFVIKPKGGGKPRAVVTSDNPKMKPYRSEVAKRASLALFERDIQEPMAERHVPVGLVLDFYFARPASCPKKRGQMVVKPDLDKLIRSTKDAMKGVIYFDDSQVVEVSARKHYGTVERVEVSATVLAEQLTLSEKLTKISQVEIR